VKVKHWYYLEGMNPEMWDKGHEKYGKPNKIVGWYLGMVSGTRNWHAFEIQTKSGDEGVLFMNDADIAKLKITEIVE
jgi:hypothetical protein